MNQGTMAPFLGEWKTTEGKPQWKIDYVNGRIAVSALFSVGPWRMEIKNPRIENYALVFEQLHHLDEPIEGLKTVSKTSGIHPFSGKVCVVKLSPKVDGLNCEFSSESQTLVSELRR